jgi:ABC-type sugar transport system permease subunit
MRKRSYEQKKQLYGWFFVLPFIIGFVLFFILPAFQSIRYSFSVVRIGEPLIHIGWANYRFLLNENPTFRQNLFSTFFNLIPQVGIIIFFSLFIAVILNQQFKGRALVRSLFFLPVIITAGAVMELMYAQIFADAGNTTNVYLFRSTALRDILYRSGMDGTMVYYITAYVNQIFTFTWKSGVQILLFLAGLQTIPAMYYEAASVEGASGWESFWKITIPLISPVMFANIIYTIVDTFTDTANPVLKSIYNAIRIDLQFGLGAAQAWMFFTVIAIVIAISFFMIGRKITYLMD